MAHPSAVLTLALVAGLAAGVSRETPPALALALVMSAAWTAAVLCYRREHPRLQIAAVAVLVGTAGWAVGAHAVQRALHPPLRARLDEHLGGFALGTLDVRAADPIVIEGRLTEDAALTAHGAVLRMDVAGVWLQGRALDVRGGVSLGVGGNVQADFVEQWTAGRVVRTPALLRRPARHLNHGVPDGERALARRGVALVGTIKSAMLVEVVARGRWWEEAAAVIRSRTRSALRRHVQPLSGQSAAIATAILVGDRTGLDDDVEIRLQEAGTYHVLAISGGNIAILTGLLLGAMALAGFRGRGASMAAILLLSAYVMVAEGGPSVLRATLMAAVYLAARLIDQRTAALNAVSLTAAIVLLAAPLAVVDVGFWLTFGATVALVVGGGAAFSTKRAGSRALAALAAVVVATACVEVVLAPVGALVFHRVTLAGLLLNLVALPAMTAVQIGAMAVVLCDVLALDRTAAAAGHGVHVGALALTESARLLDVAPWLTWRVPPPDAVVVAAYYAALVAAVIATRRSARRTRRWTAWGAVIGLFVWIVGAPSAHVRARGDGRLHLTVFDVGQGDAMLVTFPNGRTLLVDAGGGSPSGTFDIGERVIGPALRARGLLALDYLAVTHGDPDHIGGARTLLRDFRPREVWWGIPVHRHAPADALRSEAGKRRAAWRTLQRGDLVDIGGVAVRVHHPPPPDWERQRVRNDDSLVLELRHRHVSLLLTGDIERDAERELAPHLELAPLVVLKVAHHGSATSSTPEFLGAVRPDVALIGVGRANPYGHPVPPVLERLHATGAAVFRTDLDGQIELTTDGDEVEVRAFLGRTHRARAEARDDVDGGVE